jgi:hypothetical protein
LPYDPTTHGNYSGWYAVNVYISFFHFISVKLFKNKYPKTHKSQNITTFQNTSFTILTFSISDTSRRKLQVAYKIVYYM